MLGWWHDRRLIAAAVIVGVLGLAAAIVVPVELVGRSSPSGEPSTKTPRVTTTTTTVPSTTTTATSTLPTVWTQRTVPVGVKGPLNAVTCPTDTTCYAVGGAPTYTGSGYASIITSKNGGSTWASAYTTPGSYLSAIACGDPTRCVAVGATDALKHALLMYTSDGGRQWSQGAVPGQVANLGSVACTSATACIAGGQLDTASGPAVLRSTDGGSTWAPASVPASLSYNTTLACPTGEVCFAGGSGEGPESSSPSVVARSTDDGETWSAPTILDHPSGFGDIVCVDTEDCAGDIFSGATTSEGQGTAASTSDGGTSWSISGTAIGGRVACSSTMCLSVGGLPRGTTPNQRRWYVTAFVSTTDGRTWTAVTVPTYQGVFDGATCDSADDCVVVGGGTDATSTTAPAVIMMYGH
jgi:hypothetical protein